MGNRQDGTSDVAVAVELDGEPLVHVSLEVRAHLRVRDNNTWGEAQH